MDNIEEVIGTEQNENKEKTIETITGLIRYGYQEAIDDISKFVSDNCGSEITDYSASILQQKLIDMANNKHLINLDKLSKEIPE